MGDQDRGVWNGSFYMDSVKDVDFREKSGKLPRESAERIAEFDNYEAEWKVG